MLPNNPSLAQLALNEGGSLHPLIIPAEVTGGTGLMNPSIFNDDGQLLVNLRHVNYTFYHSEKKLFQHQFGPLTYVHPEKDMHLRTTNYYLELDDDLNITRHTKVDTSRFDVEPKWEFVGLEDARLFRWHSKLYLCGVRRDTTTNGQGRMELSEIEVTDSEVKEVSRFRIPPPIDLNSYCEKNWMPVLDMPYHFIKWTNPTELVKIDPHEGTCTQVRLNSPIPFPRDLRGGSQVIPWQGGYLAITHEVDLFKSEVGRKDAIYRHRFIHWGRSGEIESWSRDFDFMNGYVEFAAGMTKKGNDILISFGFQDNAAFVLKVPEQVINKMLNQVL